jgi:Zn-dependent protease with chaperone function
VATDTPVGVDFFDRQHAARGTTLRLVGLFVVAIIGIVVAIDLVVLIATSATLGGFSLGWLIFASIVSLLIIAGGTLSKMAQLRAGGAAIALSMGGVPIDPTTTDPQLRRFVNVVEEMSIASGVPMPRLFVMPQEGGINAFAAGYGPSDAAITVTGGALQQLNRDELQGVIGHEFSHILNGDMRMNVRLIGLVAGLLVLGLVGLRILQFSGGGKKDKNAGIILIFGLAALILGFVGQFFAGMIKAAVARQREWLADASSIQFTRQTTGLSGALKKIAGVPAGSVIANAHTEKQINHMLFGEGGKSISQLWATHPPLIARIQALEPNFDPRQIKELERQYAQQAPIGMLEDQQLGLVGPTVAMPHAVAATTGVAARIGTFSADDLVRGAAISAQLPPRLRDLARQPSTAVPLVLALLVDADERIRGSQLSAIAAQLAPSVAEAVAQLFPEIVAVPPLLRMPLAGLALPALSAGPRPQVERLVTVIDALITADGTCSAFEYCMVRLISAYLRDTLDPQHRAKPGSATVEQMQDAASTLIAVVAAAGNGDPSAANRAFNTAIARLGLPPRAFSPPQNPFSALDGVWEPLDSLAPLHKRTLIEAVVAAIADDGTLAIVEAELLRATCALLHCPVPALLG